MLQLPTRDDPALVYEGSCRKLLKQLPDACVDAVITDPPYPEIDRDYGRWTEDEWFALMDVVVPECRRVLKLTGSAVFVIQPNMEKVGKMRTWWLRFMLRWAEEWGMVQDVWWWNFTSPPLAGCQPDEGLMRASVKPLVWLGLPDCHRDQNAVIWEESKGNALKRAASRFDKGRESRLSIHSINDHRARQAAASRGGTTPFNLLPVANSGRGGAGSHGHGAGTPMDLARWWTRYICPPGGLVLDPFLGSGTMLLAALEEGRRGLGFERIPEYVGTARRRIDKRLAGRGMPLEL